MPLTFSMTLRTLSGIRCESNPLIPDIGEMWIRVTKQRGVASGVTTYDKGEHHNLKHLKSTVLFIFMVLQNTSLVAVRSIVHAQFPIICSSGYICALSTEYRSGGLDK